MVWDTIALMWRHCNVVYSCHIVVFLLLKVIVIYYWYKIKIFFDVQLSDGLVKYQSSYLWIPITKRQLCWSFIFVCVSINKLLKHNYLRQLSCHSSAITYRYWVAENQICNTFDTEETCHNAPARARYRSHSGILLLGMLWYQLRFKRPCSLDMR